MSVCVSVHAIGLVFVPCSTLPTYSVLNTCLLNASYIQCPQHMSPQRFLLVSLTLNPQPCCLTPTLKPTHYTLHTTLLPYSLNPKHSTRNNTETIHTKPETLNNLHTKPYKPNTQPHTCSVLHTTPPTRDQGARTLLQQPQTLNQQTFLEPKP